MFVRVFQKCNEVDLPKLTAIRIVTRGIRYHYFEPEKVKGPPLVQSIVDTNLHIHRLPGLIWVGMTASSSVMPPNQQILAAPLMGLQLKSCLSVSE